MYYGYENCGTAEAIYSNSELLTEKPEHILDEDGNCSECGNHVHSEGTPATCGSLAVCALCGEEYGEFGGHTVENGVCTICGMISMGRVYLAVPKLCAKWHSGNPTFRNHIVFDISKTVVKFRLNFHHNCGIL